MLESPSSAPLQIDKGIEVVTEQEPVNSEHPPPGTIQESDSAEASSKQVRSSPDTTPPRAMDCSLTDISREILGEIISPRASQVVSGPYEALLPQTSCITPGMENSEMIGQDIPLDTTTMEVHEDYGRTGTSGFNITRREILT